MRLPQASVDRARRLVEANADMLLSSFAGRARALGAGLGVERSTADVYGEAELRSSTAFQLSSLLTQLSAGCVAALGGDGYEVLVGGGAEGVLLEADRLEPGALQARPIRPPLGPQTGGFELQCKESEAFE